MRLSARTVSALAEMICGASGNSSGFSWMNFPYRSSAALTRFFSNAGLNIVHGGETRQWWVEERLAELNRHPASNPSLPSDSIVSVIRTLLDPLEFREGGTDHEGALEDVNPFLRRDGLEAYLDGAGRCHVRSIETSESSASLGPLRRALTSDELELRDRVEEYLDEALEDEFIEDILVPLFRQLGFSRPNVAGHKDKSLEFGKDLWMKYQLPTHHSLYFGVQAKRGKIDASAGSANRNVATILDQIRMSLSDPVFDPEVGRRSLIDHVMIIAAGEITKAAKRWLAEHLDAEQRRSVLFMDRAQILDLWVQVQLPAPGQEEPNEGDTDWPSNDLPF